MLIITGPGRCGTSLLAHYCRELGHDPGGEWHHRRELNAGWEDRHVVKLNTDIESRGDVSRALGDRRLVSAIRGVGRSVVKDPRFLYRHALPLRTWWAVRQDLRVLVLYRRPDAFARSVRAQIDHFAGYGGLSFDDIRHTAAQRFADGVQACVAGGIPLRVLVFPAFLADYDYVHHCLSAFGELPIAEESGRRIWEQLADPEKVRAEDAE